MKKGFYTVEVNNCIFITFWDGEKFIEDDKTLANFLKEYPVKVKRCFKEL